MNATPPSRIKSKVFCFFSSEKKTFLPISLTAVLCHWHPAAAVPSFAEQTGQPCAACHVGAFGPQLRPYGRAFKLLGYVAGDGKHHFPPIAATAYGSFTHTNQAQQGGAARGFGPNDNAALDQISLYYAGTITRHAGAFIQTTYDGVNRQLHLDNMDIRYARERDILGKDAVLGLTLNDNPTVQDLWNSTPVWGFPYNRSALAPSPIAATRIDGSFAQAVLGLGAYTLWNDWIYAEIDLYRGLGRDIRNATGIVPVADTDSVVDTAPYWRLALQHDEKRISWEIGTYGIAADIQPGAAMPGTRPNRFVDAAADANVQLTISPRSVTSDVVSFHTTLITETQDFGGQNLQPCARLHGGLQTARADLSYSIAATVTPSVQYFDTQGSRNPAYWQTPGGNPDSRGEILEIAYVPFGKPGSPIPWGNLRLAAQYVLYDRFDGRTSGAAGQDALYVSAWVAWHF